LDDGVNTLYRPAADWNLCADVFATGWATVDLKLGKGGRVELEQVTRFSDDERTSILWFG